MGDSTTPQRSVVVVSTDRVTADALARAFDRHRLQSSVREPRGDLLDSVGTIVLDLTGSTEAIAAWLCRSQTDARLIALGGDAGSLPSTVGIDAWLDADSSIDDVVAVINGREASASAPEPVVPDQGPLAELTPREQQVLARLAAGDGSPAIGEQLAISEHTVRTHLQNVLAKLHVNSRAEAVAVALRHGIHHLDRTTGGDRSDRGGDRTGVGA